MCGFTSIKLFRIRPELDVALVEHKKLRLVAKVKWENKIRERDVRKVEDKFEEDGTEVNLLIVPDKGLLPRKIRKRGSLRLEGCAISPSITAPSRHKRSSCGRFSCASCIVRTQGGTSQWTLTRDSSCRPWASHPFRPPKKREGKEGLRFRSRCPPLCRGDRGPRA